MGRGLVPTVTRLRGLRSDKEPPEIDTVLARVALQSDAGLTSRSFGQSFELREIGVAKVMVSYGRREPGCARHSTQRIRPPEAA